MRVVSDTVADIIAVDSEEFPLKHQTVFQEDNKTSKLRVNFLLSSLLELYYYDLFQIRETVVQCQER